MPKLPERLSHLKGRISFAEEVERLNWPPKPRKPSTPEQLRKKREYGRKLKYGITVENYNRMVADQGGVCAICGNKPTGHRPVLCVDHCHNTKTIRGLLCSSCNTGLGSFKDNIKSLESAIAYLSRFRSTMP